MPKGPAEHRIYLSIYPPMLSQTTEYALRAIICLAQNDGVPQTATQIAESMKVPYDYLAKVMQGLGRAGLVNAQRGRGGGFVLAIRPERMTVLDVVKAVDPIRRIKVCPLGLPQHREALCPLHKKLDEALAALESAFATTCIADVLETPALVTEVAHAS